MGIENKVHVTKLFGGGGALGVISPRLNMVTNKGTIIAINSSGRYTVSVSGQGVGALTEYYPEKLFTLYSHVTGVWSWPTGDGSVVFSRSGIWPNGVSPAVGTGLVYKEGIDTDANAGVKLFSRP